MISNLLRQVLAIWEKPAGCSHLVSASAQMIPNLQGPWPDPPQLLKDVTCIICGKESRDTLESLLKRGWIYQPPAPPGYRLKGEGMFCPWCNICSHNPNFLMRKLIQNLYEIEVANESTSWSVVPKMWRPYDVDFGRIEIMMSATCGLCEHWKGICEAGQSALSSHSTRAEFCGFFLPLPISFPFVTSKEEEYEKAKEKPTR